MRTVMVAGKFDPLHDGHIHHIKEAAKLGDYLYVVTHSDDVLRRIKGRVNIPYWARADIAKGVLKQYGIAGGVFCSVDDDGTVIKTLEYLKPSIFAKGGDRTPDNMPFAEIEVCKRIECELVYGIGDLINSSSKIMGNNLRAADTRYLVADCHVDGVAFSETVLHAYQETRGHTHPNREIYYFLKEGGCLTRGDTSIPTRPGMVVVIEPNEFHKVHNLTDADISFVCCWPEQVKVETYA